MAAMDVRRLVVSGRLALNVDHDERALAAGEERHVADLSGIVFFQHAELNAGPGVPGGNLRLDCARETERRGHGEGEPKRTKRHCGAP
jgi:hypothetical protein